MNVLFTLNDNFVPQVAACICSVLENNKEASNINIYLIGEKITEENVKKLTKMVRNYGETRKLYVIPMQDIQSYFDFSFNTYHWNSIILSRLLLDKLLPESVDRIIYLDGDTMVRDSLTDLWNLDMGNCVIGAAIESTVPKQRKIELGIENEKPYYNSGVLLINMNKWRENNIGEQLIAYYKAHDGNLYAADQDTINGALKNDVFTISPKYNFYNIHYLYSYSLLKKLTAPAEYVSEEVFLAARNHPTIIHFLGEDRPWKKACHHKYKKEYDVYRALTPWGDLPKENDRKLYLHCFWLLNIFTKPVPQVRVWIIAHFSARLDAHKLKNKK